MTTFTVAPDPVDEVVLAEIVASLPVSLRHVSDRETADFIDVAGTQDWVRGVREALGAKPTAVIVTNPGAARSDAVLSLAEDAERAGIPVWLAEPFAGSPALLIDAQRIMAAVAHAENVFIDLRLRNGATTDSVLVALRVLSRLGLAALRLEPVTGTGTGFVTEARITHSGGEAAITITGATTQAGAPAVRVRTYGGGTALEIDLPDVATARPALVAVSDQHGTAQMPTVYETAYRALWRRVASGSESLERSGEELRSFARDLASVETQTVDGP